MRNHTATTAASRTMGKLRQPSPINNQPNNPKRTIAPPSPSSPSSPATNKRPWYLSCLTILLSLALLSAYQRQQRQIIQNLKPTDASPQQQWPFQQQSQRQRQPHWQKQREIQKPHQLPQAQPEQQQQQQQQQQKQPRQEQQGPNLSAQPQEQQRKRKLTLADLQIGKLLGEGSVNFVFDVKLPGWWHDQQKQANSNHPATTTTAHQYVLKIADPEWRSMAQKEEYVLQTLNSQNPTLARQLKITPIIWSDTSIPNPWCANGILQDGATQQPWPLPKGAEKKWRKYPMISAIIVPNEVTRGQNHNVYESSILSSSIQTTIRFMHTLLRTLAYAHRLEINVNDISSSNVHCDHQGNAIVSDWNNAAKQGEAVYDEEMNVECVAPEYQFEVFEVIARENDRPPRKQKQPTLLPVNQTAVHAFDTWSAGILFANLLWPHEDDCQFLQFVQNHRNRETDQKLYLQHLMLRGLWRPGRDNGRIVLNDSGDQANLAGFLGLDNPRVIRSVLRDNDNVWRLPICEGRYYKENDFSTCRPCRNLMRRGMLRHLEDPKRAAAAVDLIRRMLTLSLQDRPTADDLLGHEFFAGFHVSD